MATFAIIGAVFGLGFTWVQGEAPHAESPE